MAPDSNPDFHRQSMGRWKERRTWARRKETEGEKAPKTPALTPGKGAELGGARHKGGGQKADPGPLKKPLEYNRAFSAE